MQDSKSLRSALPTLVQSLMRDFAGTFPSLKDSFQHDVCAIVDRVHHEGIEFLTTALPRFYKAVLQGLESGRMPYPLGFQRKRATRRPLFLQGLTARIFDDEGELLVDPDENAICFIGQLCQLFYKLDLPYSSAKNRKVIDAFVQTEKDLENLNLEAYDPILEEAGAIMRDALRGFDPKLATPQHGPGATATGERFFNKWNFKRKYRSIHREFPYYEWFVPSRASLLRRIRWYRGLRDMEHGTAKVVLVPKDSRGPRLISEEPLEFQFIQQVLRKGLYEWLEKRSPVRGYVNFTDQSINQREALKASKTREYATLDLKEASDRVSTTLVKRLFSGTGLLAALLATRTAETKLPDGRVLRLRKFAPMGSALCFPVEALCFYTLAEAIRRMWRIPGKIYVYGDDLIVPRRLVPFLFDKFPEYGLKFNEDKCFKDGSFRESCGCDAYNGYHVNPVRMRKLWPKSRRDAHSVASAVDFVNRLFTSGYWHTADLLQGLFARTYGIDLPVSPVSDQHFSGLSWKTFQAGYRGMKRWNKKLHCWDISSYVLKQKVIKVKPSSEARLFANLVGQATTCVPVPQAGSLNLRWCASMCTGGCAMIQSLISRSKRNIGQDIDGLCGSRILGRWIDSSRTGARLIRG